jgi:tRNA(Arg) A34 adenosine deaminase TadA
MSNNDNLMKEACDLATYSVSIGGGPFGAVITNRNDEIIGCGHNRVTIDNDPTQHAEIVAIRDACKNLNTFNLDQCKIYTSCEPCPMCLSAIYWSRINMIYYGNNRKDAKNIGFDDDFIYNEINKDNNERSIEIVCCNKEYAKISFEEWLRRCDKIPY